MENEKDILSKCLNKTENGFYIYTISGVIKAMRIFAKKKQFTDSDIYGILVELEKRAWEDKFKYLKRLIG